MSNTFKRNHIIHHRTGIGGPNERDKVGRHEGCISGCSWGITGWYMHHPYCRGPEYKELLTDAHTSTRLSSMLTQLEETQLCVHQLLEKLENSPNFFQLKSAVEKFISEMDMKTGVLGDGDLMRLAYESCVRRGKNMATAQIILLANSETVDKEN